ncbi:MAG: adenylate/guanylate cyclase domain-containing protein [Alphaproteobacteria bacterium]|nr:adenylate/guanylate cyclase domain-containing protein [Alphaproteobacteria bacterium]
MAGSVALYERDEAGTVARWAALLRRLEGAVLPGSGGRLVKSTGDGFILEFGDVSAAMRCASALHREFAAASAGAPPGMEMAARIGVNLADVYANEADIYGRGVNLAARLGSLAQPGGTIVSDAIRDRLVPGLDCEVEDIGPSYFKHATEPVPAFRVIADGEPERRLLGLGAEVELQPAVAIIPFEGRLVDPAYVSTSE